MAPDIANAPRVPESYRASCDSCTDCKVRCGKEQPTCSRCQQRGLDCVYRLSQRPRKPGNGGQRAGSRGSTSTTSSETASAIPRNRKKNRPSKQSSAPVAPSLASTIFSAPPPHGTSGLAEAQPQSPLDPRRSERRESEQTSQHTFDMETEAWVCPPMTDLLDFSDMGMPDFLSLTADEITSQTSYHSSSASSVTRLTADDQDMGNDFSPVRSCPAALLEAVKQLGLQTASCTGVSPNMQVLGNMLKAGRSALSRALEVVACDCAPNTNVALLMTLTISRTLALYEDILRGSSAAASTNDSGGDSGSTETFMAAAAIDSGNSSDMNLHAAAGFDQPDTRLVRQARESLQDQQPWLLPPMNIGDYELDLDDKLRFIVLIVLGDLAKIRRLMDDFSAKFCGSEDTVASSSTSPSITSASAGRSDFHVSLDLFLRNKMSNVMMEAQGKLQIGVSDAPLCYLMHNMPRTAPSRARISPL